MAVLAYQSFYIRNKRAGLEKAGTLRKPFQRVSALLKAKQALRQARADQAELEAFIERWMGLVEKGEVR